MPINNPDLDRFTEGVERAVGTDMGLPRFTGRSTNEAANESTVGGGTKENPISSQDNSEKALKTSRAVVDVSDKEDDVSGGSGERTGLTLVADRSEAMVGNQGGNDVTPTGTNLIGNAGLGSDIFR